MFRANVYVKTRPPVRSAAVASEPFDVDLAFNAPRENDRVRSEGEGRERVEAEIFRGVLEQLEQPNMAT